VDREQGMDRSDSGDFQWRGKAEDREQGRTRSDFVEVRNWRGKPGNEDNLVVNPPNIAWKTIGGFQREHYVLLVG